MSKNLTTSRTEENVRQKLRDAGLKLHKGRSAIQCGFEPKLGNYPILTPDILLSGTQVAVEVDSDYTHADELDNDRLRNQLLNDLGWTVVRLRLGGLTSIGDYDVVCGSSTATQAAIAALVEAVADAVAGTPGHIRHVPKSATPKRTKPLSRLGATAAHKYTENAFYVSWKTDDGIVERMVAMDGGNFLASIHFGAPRFICWLGLASQPKTEWKTPLTELLTSMTDFSPVSRFPWGDELFVGDQAANVNVFDKFNVGGNGWDATSNLTGVDAFTDTAFFGGEALLAQLHPGAVDAGWRLEDLRLATGMFGPYQRFHLMRCDERAGLWATAEL